MIGPIPHCPTCRKYRNTQHLENAPQIHKHAANTETRWKYTSAANTQTLQIHKTTRLLPRFVTHKVIEVWCDMYCLFHVYGFLTSATALLCACSDTVAHVNQFYL